jgi:hypothetical protein
LRRIAIELGVSISSVSVWVRDLKAPGSKKRRVEGRTPVTPSGEYKRCGRCSRDLPIERFNRHPERGRQHWCRDCFMEYFRVRGDLHRAQSAAAKHRRRTRARQFIGDYLAAHPCVDCEVSDPLVLEFDHLEGKRANLSALVAQGWSLERLKQEMALCDVVCVNCHRRRTAHRGRSWRLDPTRLDSNTHLLPGERRNMRLVLETLSKAACVDCGVRDLLVLEFDHLGVKRDSVMTLARRGCSQKVIEEEIARCEIRCANCHRRRTRETVRSAAAGA